MEEFIFSHENGTGCHIKSLDAMHQYLNLPIGLVEEVAIQDVTEVLGGMMESSATAALVLVRGLTNYNGEYIAAPILWG
ncbi:unnamed protein product [Dovyalis caffra]|uniref:Uncharacterized protein n=1 Tax=Dovyalis caffra TaxID=77055 RepID=A0AAV1R9H4_9ROSI|nr:unnamed protein product [Dovyalis caffra]